MTDAEIEVFRRVVRFLKHLRKNQQVSAEVAEVASREEGIYQSRIDSAECLAEATASSD